MLNQSLEVLTMPAAVKKIRSRQWEPPEEKAREVLDAQWGEVGDEYPVDPVIIARNLGVNVYQSEMPPSVSGYIIKRGAPVAPDIFVNSEHAPVRQRFTVAHELGHYFNRKDIGGEHGEKYALRRDALAHCGTDAEEIYANKFAAELLMPDQIVADLVDEGLSDMEISRRLKVSLESLGYRRERLGI